MAFIYRTYEYGIMAKNTILHIRHPTHDIIDSIADINGVGLIGSDNWMYTNICAILPVY